MSVNKVSAGFLSAAIGFIVVGCWLIHPAVAFIVGGLALAAVGVLSLDTEG